PPGGNTPPGGNVPPAPPPTPSPAQAAGPDGSAGSNDQNQIIIGLLRDRVASDTEKVMMAQQKVDADTQDFNQRTQAVNMDQQGLNGLRSDSDLDKLIPELQKELNLAQDAVSGWTTAVAEATNQADRDNAAFNQIQALEKVTQIVV